MNVGVGQWCSLRRWALIAGAVAVGIALVLASSTGRALAAPGTPDTPQAGTPVYQEDFQNAPGTAPSNVTTYTGGASAASETYTADPYWTPAGNNCNGWILSASTPLPSPLPTGCNTTAWTALQDVAIGLGELQGETAAQSAGNFALSEWTNGSGPAGVELETSPDKIPAAAGHFYDVRADYGVFDYSGGGAGCATTGGRGSADDPEINLYLIGATSKLQVGSQLDPCTAPGNHELSVNGSSVRVAQLVSSALRWTGGSTMGVEQDNANGTGDAGNDGATDNIQIVDVTPQLDKSFSPATLTAGQPSTLTFTITNTSELGAKNGWSFTDSLPSGLTVANPSGAVTTCAAGTAVTAPAGASSVAVTGNLAQGTAGCTVSVNVTSSAIASYSNGPANVTTDGLNPPGNATVTFQGADVQLTKSASPQTGVPGTNETYRLVARNNGPATASAATVSDPLPKGLTFVSASSGCASVSGTVSCTAGDLASGASKTFTVVAKIASSDTGRITNAATVHSPTPDPDPSNNTSTTTVAVGAKADLQLLKTGSVSSLSAGGQITYTLVVNNNGPSDATGVTVNDPLPSGETLVAAKPSQGSCAGTTCQLGMIANGGSAQILVSVDTATTDNTTIKNTANVIGNNPDPDPGNNDDGSTVAVTQPPAPPAPPQPVANLQVQKRVDHGKAYPGQTLTYTLKVTNHGPNRATHSKVTDAASMGLKVLQAKASQGSCKARRPITCSLGTIANGKTVAVTVTAKVLKVGTEKNSGSATSAGRDPNINNNLASAKTALYPVLRLHKTAAPKTVKAGGTVTYHIRATNPTSVAIKHVRACDTLPLGLTFTGAGPRAKLSKGKECWPVRKLGAHKSRTFTVHAKALKGTSGKKTNHATVTGKGATGAKAHSTVRVKAAPKPKPTPVTG